MKNSKKYQKSKKVNKDNLNLFVLELECVVKALKEEIIADFDSCYEWLYNRHDGSLEQLTATVEYGLSYFQNILVLIGLTKNKVYSMEELEEKYVSERNVEN